MNKRIVSVLLTAVLLGLSFPIFTVHAASGSVTFKINSAGNSETAAVYSQEDLSSMPQSRQYFSSLDQTPAPVVVLAEGVNVGHWLSQAGIDEKQVEKIILKSDDGWSKSLPGKELFQSDRFYYPQIVTGWTGTEFKPEAQIGAVLTEPMLALKSSELRYDTALDWSRTGNGDGLRFCFGQSNIKDDVNASYGKHLSEIEFFLDDTADMKKIIEQINANIPGHGGTQQDLSGIDVYYDDSGKGSGEPGLMADTLTIKVGYFGGAYTVKKVYTPEELERLPQVEQAYTWIDRMPAVVLNSARGVRLTDILKDAGIDLNSVETFYFYCKDVSSTWYQTLPKAYLLETERFYYPNLPSHWDMELQAPTFGASVDAQRVDTIIALEDHWQRFASEPDFPSMTADTRFRLCFGQTDTHTPNAFRSAKWIHSIEIMVGGTPPTGVYLDQAMLRMKVGSKVQLTAAVEGDGDHVDKRVNWSSSNPGAVAVDDQGNVTVLKEEAAEITVSTVVGNKKAVCIVNGEEAVGKDLAGKDSGSGTFIKGSAEKQTPTPAVSGRPANDGSGKQPWRIHEISKDAVALAAPKADKEFVVYIKILFLICFAIGLGKGYRIYRQEDFRS